MYGIVNKSIEELVKNQFGEDKWVDVKKCSGIDVDYFISNQPYDDAITYQLANAISEVMNIPLEKVLYTFGEWWILKTTTEKYEGLMHAGGNSLKKFLLNLPEFHNHIMLMYPKLTPPEFKVSDVTENSIHIHYLSKRVGLSHFVHGLLMGLAKLYKTPATVTLIESNKDLMDSKTAISEIIPESVNQEQSILTQEIFKVTW